MAGLGAPELGGLGGDSLREELPQLACFSAFRGEEGGEITGRDEAVLGEAVVIGEKITNTSAFVDVRDEKGEGAIKKGCREMAFLAIPTGNGRVVSQRPGGGNRGGL